ncbi:MAG: hypothetical protein Q8Q04_03770 [archaeon]|nr:hypothetical protein [archaeon]
MKWYYFLPFLPCFGFSQIQKEEGIDENKVFSREKNKAYSLGENLNILGGKPYLGVLYDFSKNGKPDLKAHFLITPEGVNDSAYILLKDSDEDGVPEFLRIDSDKNGTLDEIVRKEDLNSK